MDGDDQTRRRFLAASVAAAAGMGTGLGAGLQQEVFGQALAPTPECRDADEPTPRQTEGPFYKPRSPQRADLREPGLSGPDVELAGRVLTRACKPVPGALVDLWHCDGNGDYDQRGDRCRGHLFADGSGGYLFRTIRPVLYPGRTRHFHVKVQAPRGRILTTQLYFPDEPQNARDGLFRRDLLMRVSAAGSGYAARFDFVLDIA